MILHLLLIISILQVPQELPSRVGRTGTLTEETTYVIYRVPRIGSSGTNWVIYDEDKVLCRLSNKKYITYKRAPGPTTLKIKTGGFLYSNKTYDLQTSCGAGQTCYIKTILESNGWKNWALLAEVDEVVAKVDLANLSTDHCNK